MNHSEPTELKISPWIAPLVYWIGRYILLPLYFKNIEVEGLEHVPKEGAVIFAPMHRSRWDAFMVPLIGGRLATGRDLHFMVSADEMKGLQGWIIRQMGGFEVDTTRPSLASIRTGVGLLRSERVMVVFPEGNIFKDSQVHPLKGGLARMALQASKGGETNVKIVPVGIYYDRQPDVPWGTSIKIRVAQPLETQDYQALATKVGANQLMDDLMQSLTQIQDQLQLPEEATIDSNAKSAH
jgi:1-acyl-sn-glycerol-3-phosphate acyltransferase